MKTPYALIDGYFEGMLSDEQFAELVAWLHADDEHACRFARWAQLRCQIDEQMRGEDIATVMLDEAAATKNDNEIPGLVDVSPHAEDFDQVLALLDAPVDDQGDLIVLGQTTEPDTDGESQAVQPKMSAGEVLSISAYLVGQAAKNHTALIVGLAAALALVASLVFVLPGSEQPDERTADSPAIPQEQQPNVVATLTAQHNAAWTEPASAGGVTSIQLYPGDALASGQRLTLTQGFAEITTTRGAIAIIQAPATIELTDNHNALRLRSGKIVGICETASSKGFLVRTEQADFVDIGTVFGVMVDSTGRAVAEVIEGEIELRPSPSGQRAFKPERFTTGQAAAVDASGEVVTPDPSSTSPFQGLAARQHGVTEITGQLTLLPRSQMNQFIQRNDNAYLIFDLPSHWLGSDIEVASLEPGRQIPSKPITVPAGKVIQSCVIHFVPKVKPGETTARCRGQVTFAGRVLGVIATHPHANGFATALGERSVDLFAAGRPLAWPEFTGQDQLRISEDGRTLAFDFSGEHFDSMRVVIETQDSSEAPTN